MIDEMIKMNEAIEKLVEEIEEKKNLSQLFADYGLNYDYCKLMQANSGVKDPFLKGLILGVIYGKLDEPATEGISNLEYLPGYKPERKD